MRQTLRRAAVAVLAVLAVFIFYAPRSFAASPSLPKVDFNKWSVSCDSGMSALVLNEGEHREYAAFGLSIAGPWADLNFDFRGEVLGEQDGGRLDLSRPQSFRAVLLRAAVEKKVGTFVSFTASGGTTMSIEGGLGAPVDSRLWNGQGTITATVRSFRFHGRGGYDQALSSGYVGGAVEVNVGRDGRFASLVSYDYPLSVPRTGIRPRVIQVGGRVTLFSAKIGELVH